VTAYSWLKDGEEKIISAIFVFPFFLFPCLA